MDRPALIASPRTPHLYRLWTDLIAEEAMPQLDRWVAQRLKLDRRFGSKDRRWYAEALFTAVRWAMPAFAHEARDLEPTAFWSFLRTLSAQDFFARLAAAEIPSEGLASAGLASWFGPRLERRAELSRWTPEDLTRFLAQQNTRAPLWLRARSEASIPRILAALEQLPVASTVEVRGLAIKVLSEKSIPLQTTPIIEDGWAEIQDYGSQELMASLELPRGAKVWDACAGGGGKSLQLAALHPDAQIYASDVRAYKAAEVQKRAERAKLRNIHTLRWDGRAAVEKPRAAEQGFDLIVVDAPCSGSGTWRRSPDGRLRVSSVTVKDLHQLQCGIVEKVLPALKKGGTLVYATCSWFPEENEDVVRALRERFGLQLEREGLHGLPQHDADTLYAAVLRKI